MEVDEPAARDDMAWVSLAGGLALANSGLGAVHGLAGPLGGLTGAAHGALCGALLPHVLIANSVRAQGAAAQRLDDVSRWIGAEFNTQGAGILAIEALADWSRRAGLPGLTALGVSDGIRSQAAIEAGSSSSMKANPVRLEAADLEAVMHRAA